ncbi:NUDIX hydrolase [Burkholderia ubonensis]|uniref:NUDIX hydrolase n=1 Tax=Burkholderia ubonensis TaxID=101571 RepID=UPI000759CCFC|nr:NUDIX hydrolase family protein [Burkholderia ubonensis]KVU04609.1 NUDIX hydrolase [Burkholderia ubonensis]
MTFPCIAAARRFDPAAHLRFVIAGLAVGWVRRSDAARLARWPDVFDLTDDRVTLSDRYDTVDARSMALASAIGALAAEGAIPGWRDEIYAIRNRFDDPPLAYIERAASRFFGTQTYAVHLNGIVEYAARPGAPAAPQMWLGRRSATKATDPGMLDNVVAGGIGWGLSVHETLAKECWEEAGIPPELAARAIAGRAVQVLCSLPEGTQSELLFVYDLPLPRDFAPHNQDGEVVEHLLAGVPEVIGWLRDGRATLDASLAMLDTLLRHRWLAPQDAAGIDALFAPAA